MSDYNLGVARGLIEIAFDGEGADKAVDALDAISGAASGIEKQLVSKGKSFIAAGTTIAAGLGFAVKAAAGFEARLSAVGAVSGATEDQMEKLRAKALQLGQETAFGATDSAVAMEELVKAGLSVDDVLNGAADAAVALAAAGEITLPAAAEIAANAMNQFGLSAEKLPRVADAIAGAANASAIGVGEFGVSLGQVGAVANVAGISFLDTATAIAIMGNAGIKGSDAGTSLKTMLTSLNPVTDKQIELFKELGIITEDGSNKFQDAAGNMKGLADISEVMNKAFGFSTISTKEFNQQVKQGIDPLELMRDSASKVGKAQQLMRLETAFGSDAIRAAAILAKDGAAGFNSMADAMGEVTAAEVAAKRMDNLNGAIEELKGAFETASITIGTTFIPMIEFVADTLTGAINAFNKLPGPIKTGVAILAGLTAAFLLVAGAMLTLIPLMVALVAHLILMRAIAPLIALFKIYRGVVLGATTATAAHAAAQRVLAASFARTTFLGRVLVRVIRLVAATWRLMMGPWGLAIAAVAAMGAAIFFMSRKSKPEIEDLTEAFKEEADGIKGSVREAARLRLEKKGLIDLADKYKISLDDVIDASIKDEAAQKRLSEAIAAAKKPMEEYRAQQQAIARDVKASAGERAKAQYNVTRVSLDELSALEDLTHGVSDNAAAVDAASVKNEQYKRSQDNVAAAAKKAEDAIKSFSAALDALFSEAFDVPEALDAVRSGMNSLTKAAKENGTRTKGNTDLAIANRNALRGQVKAIGTVLDKMAETGATSEQVERKSKRLTAEFIKGAKAAGFTGDQIAEYVAVLNGVPGTVPTELTVKTDDAINDIGGLQKKIDRMEGRKLQLQIVGTEEAQKKAKKVQDAIDLLKDRQIALGLVNVDGTLTDLGRIQNKIDNISGKSITIDVNSNAGVGIFKVPAAARGGIVTKATLAVVGEGRSSEAIIPLPDLAESFLRIFEAGQVLPRQAALATSSSAPPIPQPAREPSSSRLVAGTLGIDPSGRAWIQGVAQDVYDGESDFAGSYGRMG